MPASAFAAASLFTKHFGCTPPSGRPFRAPAKRYEPVRQLKQLWLQHNLAPAGRIQASLTGDVGNQVRLLVQSVQPGSVVGTRWVGVDDAQKAGDGPTQRNRVVDAELETITEHPGDVAAVDPCAVAGSERHDPVDEHAIGAIVLGAKVISRRDTLKGIPAWRSSPSRRLRPRPASLRKRAGRSPGGASAMPLSLSRPCRSHPAPPHAARPRIRRVQVPSLCGPHLTRSLAAIAWLGMCQICTTTTPTTTRLTGR